MKIDWPGQIFGGVLRIDNRRDFDNAIRAEYEGHDCFVNISVSNATKTRSNRQNSYLWGVCYKLLSDHTGYTADEIHAICRLKFNPEEIEIGDQTFRVGKTTTKMTTIEFVAYTDAICDWASTLGIVIPPPELPNEEINHD